MHLQKIQHQLLKMINQIRATKLWWLIGLILIGAFLRFYRVSHTLLFAGDQGRDALRVVRIWQQGDLPLIGPVTSIGNMYLGPLYYYFMLPWLLLSYPSPVGPAYGVALLSILTIWLFYRLGKEMIGAVGAGLAAGMFVFSNVAVEYARFSWNPNPAPLFSLILIWALYRFFKGNHRYLILVALAFSILIQLHYMALLSAFPIILVWGYVVWQVSTKQPKKVTKLIQSSILAIVVVSVFLIPLIVFDIKHQGVNLQALSRLMGGETSITEFDVTVTSWGEKIIRILGETHGRAMFILVDNYFGVNRAVNTFLALIVIGATVWSLRRHKLPSGPTLLSLFVLVGIVGTSFYSHSLYQHYILFLLPPVFLLIGWLLAQAFSHSKWGKGLVLVFLSWFLIFNVQKYPFHDFSPGLSQLQRDTQIIAEDLSPGERYNVVLISESKDYYAQNYRYYFNTIANKAPVDPSFDDITAVETLVIINELKLSVDELIRLGIYEIEIFKDASVKKELTLPSGTHAMIWHKQ